MSKQWSNGRARSERGRPPSQRVTKTRDRRFRLSAIPVKRNPTEPTCTTVGARSAALTVASLARSTRKGSLIGETWHCHLRRSPKKQSMNGSPSKCQRSAPRIVVRRRLVAVRRVLRVPTNWPIGRDRRPQTAPRSPARGEGAQFRAAWRPFLESADPGLWR